MDFSNFISDPRQSLVDEIVRIEAGIAELWRTGKSDAEIEASPEYRSHSDLRRMLDETPPRTRMNDQQKKIVVEQETAQALEDQTRAIVRAENIEAAAAVAEQQGAANAEQLAELAKQNRDIAAQLQASIDAPNFTTIEAMKADGGADE